MCGRGQGVVAWGTLTILMTINDRNISPASSFALECPRYLLDASPSGLYYKPPPSTHMLYSPSPVPPPSSLNRLSYPPICNFWLFLVSLSVIHLR